jgi:hypothetical protein
MAYRPCFGSKAREDLYAREVMAAYLAGRGTFPICPHCDQPVTPDQAWDRSHIGAPAALGGKRLGVGHRGCNQLDARKVVVPMVAKAERVRKRHVGITGPGLGRHAMACGRRSPLKKTVGGRIVPRLTLAEQHRQLMRKRYGEGHDEQ